MIILVIHLFIVAYIILYYIQFLSLAVSSTVCDYLHSIRTLNFKSRWANALAKQ